MLFLILYTTPGRVWAVCRGILEITTMEEMQLESGDNLKILPGAEPFLIKGGPRGVLLVHGFTGAPAEMRLLGEQLAGLGFTVLGIRLPGHGTTVWDMENTVWRHWYGAVIDGWYLLKGLCDEINVIGLSMGGLLSLKLAANFPLARVVSLSAPIFLANRQLAFLPIYKLFRRFIPKQQRDYDVDPKYFVGYDQTPLSSLSSLLELIQSVETDLPHITCPSLVLQSRREHTVRPESASFIFERITARHKELFWLEKSGHVVTVDIERETVFEKIIDFLSTTFGEE